MTSCAACAMVKRSTPIFLINSLQLRPAAAAPHLSFSGKTTIEGVKLRVRLRIDNVCYVVSFFTQQRECVRVVISESKSKKRS